MVACNSDFTYGIYGALSLLIIISESLAHTNSVQANSITGIFITVLKAIRSSITQSPAVLSTGEQKTSDSTVKIDLV